MPNYNVANQSELNSALGSAVGGDTITLTSWSGSVTLTSRSYASDVTIQGDVTVGGITITDCDHIVLTGLTSEVSPGSTNCIFAGDSSDVTFDGMTFVVTGHESFTTATSFGLAEGSDNYSIGVGTAATCDNLTIRDCSLAGTVVPIRPYNPSGVTIERCTFETVRADCIKIGGTGSNITIKDNLFPRLRWFKFAAEHADCIQFNGNFTDIEISGNVFLPLVEVSTQGFFCDLPVSDITVTQNIFAVFLANGIAMSDGGTNQIATNNTIFCYYDVDGAISASQVFISTGTSARNFTGTWKASLAGVAGSNIRLCTEGDGGASAPYRPWDQYQIAAGKQDAEAIRFALDLDDLDPVTDSLADYAAQGAGTYGAYDTISRIAANGYAWPPGVAAPSPPPSISGLTINLASA